MKSRHSITVKDLVLVGGGHAHVQVLRRFGMAPMPGVRLTLISREAAAPYSGMLPGLIAGHYDFDGTHIDLRPLARFAGAQFFVDEVTGFDLENKRILCRNRPAISYDLLSINTGSTPAMAGIPGADKHAIPIKPIDSFLERLAEFSNTMQTGAARAGDKPARIGVVGGGAGGVELLLALHHRLATAVSSSPKPNFHLITNTDDILPTHAASVRRKFRRILANRDITVHAGRTVVNVEERDGEKSVIYATGNSLSLDHLFWVTEASAPHWLSKTGLELDANGFITVHDTLQTTTDPSVFAAGDIAAVLGHPRPKSGVFAVRQGPPLSENLRLALTGKPAKPYHPQSHFLSLITTGDKCAVASWRGISIEGKAVWRWKNWIDVRFMERFNSLPDMNEDETLDITPGLASGEILSELANSAMRCGGCGAKVGPEILTRVLDTIAAEDGPESPLGQSRRDDAAIVVPPEGKVMVHSVDGFRSFIDDPYMFGAIATNHALNDLFAMGATPQTALALATLPFGTEEKTGQDLAQMMAGVRKILADHKTELIGGHTSEGLELSLSLAVNGYAELDEILRKSGMIPGQKLILTKPVGTGCLLAADMRHKAKGRWIDTALAGMLQSNAPAAKILRQHGATACTDVSGFGLLGHLLEMTEASEVTATLKPDDLPVLDGAHETIAAGIVSSLHSQNERLGTSVEATKDPSHPNLPLLYDPQTAGGLLASVPAGHAETCIAALADAGYEHAAIIGTIGARADGKAPVTF